MQGTVEELTNGKIHWTHRPRNWGGGVNIIARLYCRIETPDGYRDIPLGYCHVKEMNRILDGLSRNQSREVSREE